MIDVSPFVASMLRCALIYWYYEQGTEASFFCGDAAVYKTKNKLSVEFGGEVLFDIGEKKKQVMHSLNPNLNQTTIDDAMCVMQAFTQNLELEKGSYNWDKNSHNLAKMKAQNHFADSVELAIH